MRKPDRSRDVHPYRRAWESRDLKGWEQALSPDVVIHSPLLTAPFVGRKVAVELFAVLFESLARFEITDELAAGDTRAFFWRAESGGRPIEGADLIRLDGDGKVGEITVLIRPLVSLAAFGGAVGPPLAGQRGRLGGALVRVLNAPLTVLFSLVDRVASRLVVPR